MEMASIGKAIVETRIAAPRARVWRALTDEITRWWPQEFYTGGREGERRYLLDAHPGGRMCEVWSDTDGLLWATVNTVVKESRLDVWGVAFPLWGGPALWTGTWEIEAAGKETLVRFTEATIGPVSDEGMKDKEKGWRFLFDGALRAYVEGRSPPVWDGPIGSFGE